jgi:hypothetical protein
MNNMNGFFCKDCKVRKEEKECKSNAIGRCEYPYPYLDICPCICQEACPYPDVKKVDPQEIIN